MGRFPHARAETTPGPTRSYGWPRHRDRMGRLGLLAGRHGIARVIGQPLGPHSELSTSLSHRSTTDSSHSGLPGSRVKREVVGCFARASLLGKPPVADTVTAVGPSDNDGTGAHGKQGKRPVATKAVDNGSLPLAQGRAAGLLHAPRVLGQELIIGGSALDTTGTRAPNTSPYHRSGRHTDCARNGQLDGRSSDGEPSRQGWCSHGSIRIAPT